jgi:hypothetical protein
MAVAGRGEDEDGWDELVATQSWRMRHGELLVVMHAASWNRQVQGWNKQAPSWMSWMCITSSFGCACNSKCNELLCLPIKS